MKRYIVKLAIAMLLITLGVVFFLGGIEYEKATSEEYCEQRHQDALQRIERAENELVVYWRTWAKAKSQIRQLEYKLRVATFVPEQRYIIVDKDGNMIAITKEQWEEK